MGRRLLLILGLILLASPVMPVAYGQGEGQRVSGTETEMPPPPTTPLEISGSILPLSPDETAESPDKAKSEKTRPALPPDTAKLDPALERTNGNGQTANPPPGRGGEPKPAGTEAAGTSTAAGDRTLDPGSDTPATDPVPLGKQSLDVTVDVQGPASMNLNQNAIFRLVVRNTGTVNAINVRIHDTLPEGLDYISSQPEAHRAQDSLLSWSIRELPAGSEYVILLTVKPVKTGSYDHVAMVLFPVASKARSQVFKPTLKVDQEVSTSNVLKGQPVAFKIAVTNLGDGEARNVTIRAKLTPGLRHGSGEKNDVQTLELTLPLLKPGQREELDPLEVDAIQGGDQSCTVTATSPDVVTNIAEEKEKAVSTRTVRVVEPQLRIALNAPKERYTDTVAPYEITVENPGTAPARKVRIVATLPINGRLLQPLPPGARYDSETRRIQWLVDRIEPGGKPRSLGFQMRMGGIGNYDVSAEARGEGGLQAQTSATTSVSGLPDVDLVVSESLRVVDVGGKTTFQITLRNYGTREATNILVTAELSKNLKPREAADCPEGITGEVTKDNKVIFVDEQGNGIKRLGPRKQLVLGIVVEVTGEEPQVAICKVTGTHDGMSGPPLEDQARVKVMPSGHSRPAGR